VFLYTNDGRARGFVDTSRPDVGQMSCAQGTDSWIAENWPKLSGSNVYFDFQEADGTVSLPSESNVWTNAGFGQNDFVALDGNNCPTENSGTGSNILSEIYLSMQVRDTSLLMAAEGKTGAQFANLWATSHASQTTIDNRSEYLTVRYVSPDKRSVVVSGSAGAFAAVPATKLSIAADSIIPPDLVNIMQGAGLAGAGTAMFYAGSYEAGAGAVTGNWWLIGTGGALIVGGDIAIQTGTNMLQPYFDAMVDYFSGSSGTNATSEVSPLPDGNVLIGPPPPNTPPETLVTLPAQSGGDGGVPPTSPC